MKLTMGAQQIRAAVLHGIRETPRYERFPAPVEGDGEAVVTVAAAVAFPQVAGLDGVGRLPDGTRVAFFIRWPTPAAHRSGSAMCWSA
jgi:hypothetical protein